MILIILFFFATVSSGQPGPHIVVSIDGLDGVLLENVRQSLSIVQHQADPDLRPITVNRLFRKAESEMESALQPYGYYSPVIEKKLTKGDGIWQARFKVRLNDPVHVTGLKIQLEGQGKDEKVLQEAVEEFPLRIGSVLDHQQYEAGKQKLSSIALQLGYRDVSLSKHVILVDRQTRSASIDIVLDTGPRYLFGKTTFSADFLNHDLLRRMLPYKEGDPYSHRLLTRFRQSLLGSEYFSTVEVREGEHPDDSVKIPVQVSLEPGKKNKYAFGVGYGTDTGARGSVEWTGRLLNRYGHQFNLQLQPSERKQYFGGVYTIPIRDPVKDRLSVPGKWEKELFENTESESRSIGISYDHIQEDGEYSLYFTFLDEDFEVGVETGHATLLMPGIKTTWRFADNRIRTDRGLRVSLNLTGANESFGSDTSFVQASLAGKGILTLTDQLRVIGRLQVGATMFDTIYELPPSLRFYAGGDQSVRGYAYKSIGPRDLFGNVLGGRYLLTSSVELERAVTEQWSAAVFFDSGDAFNAVPDMDLKNGAGVGIRWNAPFGQVRIDLATSLDSGGEAWRIHFNVGTDL